jgi:hypothetical protein
MTPPADVFARELQPTHSYLQLAQRISIEQLQKTAKGEAIIIIEGHFEYRDIFPDDPIHIIDWCSRLIPNDIPTKKVSFIDLKMETH